MKTGRNAIGIGKKTDCKIATYNLENYMLSHIIAIR